MQAVVHAVEAIRAGYRHDGGRRCESMSNAPYHLERAQWGYLQGQEAIDSMLPRA
jgi:hypothetical protein